MRPVCAVSVDLDEVDLYRSLHGLEDSAGRQASRGSAGRVRGGGQANSEHPPGARSFVVYERALPRLLAFAETHSIPLSLFCVSNDLAAPVARDGLRGALHRGHVVESHSASHPYDLVRRSELEVGREVAGSFDAIASALGHRPHGFRAPGYTTSDALFDELERAGAAFDASVLPSVPYAVAKTLALAALRLRGDRSAAVLSWPRQALAPCSPYRPGRNHLARGERPLVELPMTVSKIGGAPVIGTTLVLAGSRFAPSLVRSCGRPAFFSLELHGLDFLGPRDAPDLARREPGLWVSLERKLEALSAAVRELRREGYAFTTLREVAATWPCT